jgi:hypothetical protein
VGRFISEDSVNDPANLNVYVYCANNPVINIDPTGHILINFDVLSTISKGLNLAAELDSDFEGLASSFNKFTGCLSDVKDFIMGVKQVFGQKDIKVTKDKVIVRTKDGGRKIYDKEDMKTDFQYLAALQEDKSKASETERFEKIVKDEYKDYFETVRGNESGVTLIGLRGWGIGGTEKRSTLSDEARKRGEHDYDDMLLVIDPEGNLGAFSQVNFEGSTLKGDVNVRGETETLTADYPAIVDGNHSLNATKHLNNPDSYTAIRVNNYGDVETQAPNVHYWNNKKNKVYNRASGIEIHKGGSDWVWSKGCITLFAPPNNTGQWDRFINMFNITESDITKNSNIGTFHLMTL